MARLFFALWPDESVRAEIQAQVSTFPLPGGRLVAENNTHITLAFLGDIDAGTRADLIREATSLRITPFSLTLDHVGCWPKPKIAWLAPSSPPEQLFRLAAALHLLSQNCGLSLAERPFRPHLTVARKVACLTADIPLQPISWNINKFCLLDSISHASGVEYQVKRSWPLKIM